MMAIAEVVSFSDFISKVAEVDWRRYELWVSEEGIVALVPIVTSNNVHTYAYKAGNKEEIEKIKEAFDGEVIAVKSITLRN